MLRAIRVWVTASSRRAPSRTAAGTVCAPARLTATSVSNERDHGAPVGEVVAEQQRDLRADRRQHGEHDEPAHRSGRGRDPRVVRRDRGQHRLRQLGAGVPSHLHVEHEVEPQHGEQEARARTRQRSHGRSLARHAVVVFERFTDRARRVVVLAQEEARLLNHNYIGTEHLLLGLIHEGEGVAARSLESLGISLAVVRGRVEDIIGQGVQAPSGHIPFTPRSKKVLELSLREALALGHNYIGTEHILLGLIREGEGVAAQVLVEPRCEPRDRARSSARDASRAGEPRDAAPRLRDRGPRARRPRGRPHRAVPTLVRRRRRRWARRAERDDARRPSTSTASPMRASCCSEVSTSAASCGSRTATAARAVSSRRTRAPPWCSSGCRCTARSA